MSIEEETFSFFIKRDDFICQTIDDTIENILKCPRMYGTTNECIELEIIRQLQFKFLLLQTERAKENPRYILEKYHKILRKHFPHTNTYLFVLTSTDEGFLFVLGKIVQEFTSVSVAQW